MKFAIFFILGVALGWEAARLEASEGAVDLEAAVEVLLAGLEAHPDKAVLLFRDALQTHPERRVALLEAALERHREHPRLPGQLLSAARLDYPEDEARIAEAALLTLPERAAEIRAIFLASAPELEARLAAASAASMPGGADLLPEEARQLDEKLEATLGRLAEKGRPRVRQAGLGASLKFKRHDEIRIPRQSRLVDESGLVNHLPVDREDERAQATGVVRIDDAKRPSDRLHLDESKFAKARGEANSREASMAPAEAKVQTREPAGAVPESSDPRPEAERASGPSGTAPRSALSSSFQFPGLLVADPYESTIDLERGALAPPSLFIRP